ncbi:MAG: hypothetical protein ABSC05_35915 [Candidatus Solibacter sp.]|jgi:hypothetical protein
MTRPEEAAGLTAALARCIDQRAADLAALLKDDAYRAELAHRAELDNAHQIYYHLSEAGRAAESLANALAAPTAAAVRRG